MTVTTITTHIEPGNGAALDAALSAPLALAGAHGAHLTALVFSAEAAFAQASAPSRDADADDEHAMIHVRAVAERLGVDCEVRARSSFAHGVGEVLADHLRVSDLGVLVVHGPPTVGQRMMISAAVFDSGRPLLLVPATARLAGAFDRVIVAWDGTPAAVRAVHGALPFIRAAGETLVVTVTHDKEMRPGQSAIELTHLLARHGARAAVSAVPKAGRGVLEAVAGKAEDLDRTLLVMGAVRHSPIHNLVFGSATSDLLHAGPPSAVLLAA